MWLLACGRLADGGVGARLLAAYPAYRACVIPAGTYQVGGGPGGLFDLDGAVLGGYGGTKRIVHAACSRSPQPEDLVLVTETGCEVLNRNDKHWDVVGK